MRIYFSSSGRISKGIKRIIPSTSQVRGKGVANRWTPTWSGQQILNPDLGVVVAARLDKKPQ
jgi:hypothetical protein